MTARPDELDGIIERCRTDAPDEEGIPRAVATERACVECGRTFDPGRLGDDCCSTTCAALERGIDWPDY